MHMLWETVFSKTWLVCNSNFIWKLTQIWEFVEIVSAIGWFVDVLYWRIFKLFLRIKFKFLKIHIRHEMHFETRISFLGQNSLWSVFVLSLDHVRCECLSPFLPININNKNNFCAQSSNKWNLNKNTVRLPSEIRVWSDLEFD